MIKTVGSICSGIEAASVAWQELGLRVSWFSEIAEFPSAVLRERYPDTVNWGDMNLIPDYMESGKMEAPDMICGGTPCQAFSLAGWRQGLNDERGNLTLKFVDIVETNDRIRVRQGKRPSIVFWENVENVLTDKTNAFGCLISSLAGLDEVIVPPMGKWSPSGFLQGKKRKVAWRVLDAKYFGLPQQRRRLYVVAGDVSFRPENVLFERRTHEPEVYPSCPLSFRKKGHRFEIFREYTDCLYSAYGTKWNGNAAATNGSLFVVQDDRLRRLSPLECERLMGFQDNYTNLPRAKKTSRYQVTGNSWAVPVVRELGKRIIRELTAPQEQSMIQGNLTELMKIALPEGCWYIEFGRDDVGISANATLACSPIPDTCVFGRLQDIIEPTDMEDIFISPVGCHGILRRKQERNLTINARLEEVLRSISQQMSEEEIEKRSRVQKRGRFSDLNAD